MNTPDSWSVNRSDIGHPPLASRIRLGTPQPSPVCSAPVSAQGSSPRDAHTKKRPAGEGGAGRDVMDDLLMLSAILVACGALSAWVAQGRGQRPMLYFLAGLLLGPLGLVWTLYSVPRR